MHISYSMRGDRPDMEDGLSLLPHSTTWNCSNYIEENDDETEHVFKGSVYIDSFEQLNPILEWSKSLSDSVFLKREMKIIVEDYIFWKIYTFTGIFHSRNFDQKHGDIWQFIPDECRVLDDEDALKSIPADQVEVLEKKYALGIIQWNHVRYKQRFNKVWAILKNHQNEFSSIPQTSYSIALTGWNDDLRHYLNSIDAGDPELLNLEWWADLKPMFLGRFLDLLGIDKFKLIEQISESFDKEYRISRDLEDEQFELRLLYPGRIIGGDGIKDDEGGVLWSFSGKDLLAKDVLMHSISIKLSLLRLGLLVVSVFVIIGWVWAARRRVKH